MDLFGAKSKNRALGLRLCGVLLLAGCAAPVAQGVDDPYEIENRSMHAFNVGLDRNVLKPLAAGGSNVPPEVWQGVGNFADNLDAPGEVVNSLLQFRLGAAVENTLRFGLNTIVGVGGLFDPATAMGIEGRDTDFGETLHVWGVGEGAYMELPVLGPSTQRDTLGMVVDYAINPVRLLVPEPEVYIDTAAQILSKVGDRSRYSETFDSLLYDSADSYAQARLLYLQNRRYELGQTSGEDSYVDPYEDPYAQ